MSELSHQRVQQLIQRGHFSSAERGSLQEHFAGCDACRNYAQMHTFLAHALQLEPVRTHASPAFKAALIDRIRGQRRRELIMNPIRTFAAVAILAAVVLVAWLSLRTTADQPTISQPETTTPQATATEMPTPTPVPTSTPTPIPVLRTATTPEDIAGIWQYCIPSTPDDCYAYQYRKDGTYRGAAILSEERFENSPSVIGEFWFEGTQLHLNVLEDTLTEVWSCIGDLGIYEVQLLEDGALRFDLVDDPCPVRSEDLSQFAHYPVTLEE